MAQSRETAVGCNEVPNGQLISSGRGRATLKKHAPQQTTEKRVLVVDDDDTHRSMLAEVLMDRGYRVTTAGNVPDALRCMSSDNYEGLLSDLHMQETGDNLAVPSAKTEAVTLLLTVPLR